jgi:tetratricopeptide (TPR) repeat protein
MLLKKMIAVIILLSLLSVFLDGKISDIDKAVDCYMAGNYKDAAEYSRAYLAVNGKYATGWELLGDADVKLDKFKDAVKCYEKASQFNPARDFSGKIGEVYFYWDDLKKALKFLQAAVKKSPANEAGTAYCFLGRTLTKLKKFAEAEKSLEKARDSTGYADAVAENYYYRGGTAQAGEMFTKIFKDDNNDDVAYEYLIKIAVKDGDEAAITELNKLHDTAKNMLAAEDDFTAAQAVKNTRDYDKVIGLYRKSIARGMHKPESYENLARLYLEQQDFLFSSHRNQGQATEDYTNALDMCEEALRLNPSSAVALMVRGQIELNNSNYKAAIEDLKRAGELDDSIHVKYLLSAAYENSGDTLNAKAMKEEAQKEETANPHFDKPGDIIK